MRPLEGISAETRLTELLDTLPEAFLELDLDHRIRKMNRRAEQVVLGPPGAFIGRPVWEALPPSLLPGGRETVLRTLARGMVTELEPGDHPRLGRRFQVRLVPLRWGAAVYVWAVPVGLEGERQGGGPSPTREVPVGRSPAERLEARPDAVASEAKEPMARETGGDPGPEYGRLLEHAEQAVRARDAFLRVAAHEFRTPLTALRLGVEGIVRRSADGGWERMTAEDAARRLDLIGRQVDRVDALVNRLLDVARLASRDLELKPEPLDLVAVAARRIASSEHEAQAAGCDVTLEAVAPVIGRWDKARLEQLISHLLSNALKYGAGHPITVTVTSEGDLARLRVKDQGVGIPEDSLHRIFEPFEQAVSDRHYGGFGLGLWIVRQIAVAAGGRAYAISRPGEGAAFVVDLPLGGAAEPLVPERPGSG